VKKEFTIVAIVMLIIWGSLLTFFWIKTDEITKDPCSICSERMGEDVVCTTNTEFGPVRRFYYPNGTIVQDKVGVVQFVPIPEINFSFSK